MSLKGIIAVGGMSGLYKVISQTKSGFVVESLADQKKTIIQSTQKISMLEDISVYTSTGEKPLKEVLLLIKEKNELAVDPKSGPAELKKFFKTIVPDFDEDRVYASDIKKIILWYQLLRDIITKPDDTDTEKQAEEIKTNAETLKSESNPAE